MRQRPDTLPPPVSEPLQEAPGKLPRARRCMALAESSLTFVRLPTPCRSRAVGRNRFGTRLERGRASSRGSKKTDMPRATWGYGMPEHESMPRDLPEPASTLIATRGAIRLPLQPRAGAAPNRKPRPQHAAQWKLARCACPIEPVSACSGRATHKNRAFDCRSPIWFFAVFSG